MSRYDDGPDPFPGKPPGGQAAADRGQAAADRGQAAADRGQAAADRGQAAAERPGMDRGQAASVLRESLDSLIVESQMLRTDVRAAETQRSRETARRRQENLAMFGLLGVLSLLMLLMITVAWQNNQLAQHVKASSDQLQDCTTPGGDCYKQGQARTGQAVQTLQRIQIYIVQCSRSLPVDRYPPGPAFDKAFESCIADRLAAAQATGRGPLPSPRATATPSPARR
jgi:hypothetical protein